MGNIHGEPLKKEQTSNCNNSVRQKANNLIFGQIQLQAILHDSPKFGINILGIDKVIAFFVRHVFR